MLRWVLVLAAALPAAAQPVCHLDLAIRSAGTSTLTVAPGAAVAYEVVGTLTNAQNEGLALFGFDLGFTGGPLAPASAPASVPMTHFDRPFGFTNPAGFGGTPAGGGLLQVGGAQNTIASTLALYPTGTVIPHVAWPGSPQVLVTGTLTAPPLPGTYVLSAASVFANVLRQGQTGVPFWRVDPADAGALTPLTVSVRALWADVANLSLTTPGIQSLTLDAGVANAGRIYWMLGTVSGPSPGLPLTSGIVIPLNYDPYFQYTLDAPNGPILAGSIGLLNAQGHGLTLFHLPGGLPPPAATLTLHHAFVLLFPLDFASNAVSLDLDP